MNIFRVSSALRRSAPHRISSSSLSLEQSARQPPRLRFFSAAGNDANASTNANTDSHSHSDSSPTDFFRLFGLPRKFGIRQSELKGTYLRLMNEYHPDKQRHVVATEDDGDSDNHNDKDSDALLTAETITHAYQILKAPHTRAAHWLELHGCPLYDDDAKASASASASANGSGQTELVGVEFLAEMMEWRERIEDATTTTTMDSGGTDPAFSRRNRLEALAEEIGPLREGCEASLDKLMDERKGFSDGNAEATLAEARKLVAQLQYWNRLDETLRDAADA